MNIVGELLVVVVLPKRSEIYTAVSVVPALRGNLSNLALENDMQVPVLAGLAALAKAYVFQLAFTLEPALDARHPVAYLVTELLFTREGSIWSREPAEEVSLTEIAVNQSLPLPGGSDFVGNLLLCGRELPVHTSASVVLAYLAY